MEYVSAIGYLAACLTTLSFLPQAIRVIKTRDTESISLAMYIKKWTPTVGHISSFLKWLTQLMLRIFAYRSRPHQE
ncbi:PQ-loop domain-containing transporter [Vibrio cincinnatiensis]|uniref:PQ-loop domain-containing transporter n=1 Tax=Vibrio cincinnatiensis TaxID=675 RepID=UPI001EE12802|nr:PQ-loop domain-containing transporter [Vibrio cincinnatiensis]MCG3734500.1 hypothetical protein [Vibrio cincinnatiensis]